jgi:hypothetical protein
MECSNLLHSFLRVESGLMPKSVSDPRHLRVLKQGFLLYERNGLTTARVALNDCGKYSQILKHSAVLWLLIKFQVFL